MAKVIIGIHGLGNKPSKKILGNWWREAMLEGLEKLNKPLDLPEFELVYWSDILHDLPQDVNILEQDNPLHLHEKYVHGLANFEPEDNSLRQKLLNFLEDQLDKLFLNDDLTINYSGISDAGNIYSREDTADTLREYEQKVAEEQRRSEEQIEKIRSK